MPSPPSVSLCPLEPLCHLFGQEGASAASPVFFLPLELKPGRAQEVVEQDRTFSDPQQEA